ncbi:cation diffusion facilitator family transporter [Zoogloea sp. LCSB751]|uniref:cation diffusion facilitator family transporter n=1 Tax=Zoogloea sp. LCSB751 TaxID=1965277 RepID=UPI0009A52D39|nr:cation diffusion facilitator family transporter [Zoogloea sp. LCSB751]
MSASHTHALPSTENERALRFALALTGSFLVAEVIGGVLTGSLALISDAAHMLTDAAALAIALAAIRIARRPADRRRTYGYHRFEILAAAFNAMLLFAVALYILVEAYRRFTSPPEIHSVGMLVIASIGLIVNLISIRLLSRGQSDSLNVKGAYLEVWSDLLGSIGVIVGAVVIQLTGWSWVDPLVAVAIGLWVLPRTWILLKDSLNILLEGVPEGIDLEEVEQAMLAVPGVLGVHDLHVWALTTGKTSLTAHVVYDQTYSPEDALMPALQTVLANRFRVVHTTLQCETKPCARQPQGCTIADSTSEHGDNPNFH